MLRIQYQKELAQAHVTTQTKFNYAWGLVKSPIREHHVEGVRLLQGTKLSSPLNYPLTSPVSLRDLQGGAHSAARVFVLSGPRTLQNGQL